MVMVHKNFLLFCLPFCHSLSYSCGRNAPIPVIRFNLIATCQVKASAEACPPMSSTADRMAVEPQKLLFNPEQLQFFITLPRKRGSRWGSRVFRCRPSVAAAEQSDTAPKGSFPVKRRKIGAEDIPPKTQEPVGLLRFALPPLRCRCGAVRDRVKG